MARNNADDVLEAEKGKNLSPHNLHLRLRVVEAVLLVSLLLNIAHWFVAGGREHQMENRINDIQETRR